MAILLRTQGVPTRNVNGFIGGTFRPLFGLTRERSLHDGSKVNDSLLADGGSYSMNSEF